MIEEKQAFFEKFKDVEDSNSLIGQYLLKLREFFGMSQSEVAKAMKVSRHCVHNIENGSNKKRIPFSTFKKYLAVFKDDVSVDDFLRWCNFKQFSFCLTIKFYKKNYFYVLCLL